MRINYNVNNFHRNRQTTNTNFGALKREESDKKQMPEIAKKLIIPTIIAAGLSSCDMKNPYPEKDMFEHAIELVNDLQNELEKLNIPDGELTISAADSSEAIKSKNNIQIHKANDGVAISISSPDISQHILQHSPYFNNRMYQSAIFQALPYINDGKFKQIDAMFNGFVIDGKYKMKADRNGGYSGKYSLFDSHGFKIDRLRNGNFNLLYKNGDEIEAVAFSKDGKMLSKFKAIRQNSNGNPFILPVGETLYSIGAVKPFSSGSGLRDEYKNTEERIVKFNNPLSHKEFELITDALSDARKAMVFLDKKQISGDKLEYVYARDFSVNKPDNWYTLTLHNDIGLVFNNRHLFRFGVNRVNIQPMENGGYSLSVIDPSNEIILTNYYDKDLNKRDKEWFEKEKEIREQLQRKLSAAMMEKALENIKNGKPAHFKLGDNSVILLPKMGQVVVGETSLGVRAKTSFDEVRESIENLPAAVKAGIVVVSIAAGAYALDAIVFPSFFDGAAAMGVIPASVGAAL